MMIVSSPKEAVQSFESIKRQIRHHQEENSSVELHGDRYIVSEPFGVGDPNGAYIVARGSSFDENPKTTDKLTVTVRPEPGSGLNITQTTVFEQYTAPKMLFFSEDRLKVDQTYTSENAGGSFTDGSTMDFLIADVDKKPGCAAALGKYIKRTF